VLATVEGQGEIKDNHDLSSGKTKRREFLKDGTKVEID
jgi:hypothetical protein